ncbi:MAG: hypothetical protein VB024_10690 [Dysgonamonadaceae bacterium]|nr:hypothetical protein [Dysgonamonadaceae bacterium]
MKLIILKKIIMNTEFEFLNEAKIEALNHAIPFEINHDIPDSRLKKGDVIRCEEIPRNMWNNEDLKFKDFDFVIITSGRLELEDITIDIPDVIRISEIFNVREDGAINCKQWSPIYTGGSHVLNIYSEHIYAIYRIISYETRGRRRYSN